jgi:hypothetical protein
MIAPVNHIVGLTSIVRERVLPVSGNVIARVNQRVGATDVVAETRWAREHIFLDVARTLQLSPAAAEKLVRCKVGDKLAAGTEVARSKSLFGRSVRVPREGTVVAVGGGQVLLEVGESKFELRAGIPGLVTEVLPGRGVVIETAGSLIQGIWGNGKTDTGVLVNVMNGPEDVLTESRMDVNLRGSILLGGTIKDADTLRAAAELPARGLIVPSIFPSAIPVAREMKYPIVVTDGFGSMPMNSAAYRLLSTNAKREVIMNAELYDRYSGARPEVIIPLTISSEPPSSMEVVPFAPGLQVRMRRPPFMGSIGTIELLRPGLATLPSGLRAPAADIKLENGETVVVPLVNLEVVG